MRQLFPDAVDPVDPAQLHASLERPSPAGRPWVALNMVATVDGATQVDGLSGGLNLSVSLVLSGSAAKRATSGDAPSVPVGLRLSHVMTEDGFLFLRYLSG